MPYFSNRQVFKKIAFGDNFKRFSQWYGKVFYTFLYQDKKGASDTACPLKTGRFSFLNKKIAFPPLAGSAIGVIGDNFKRFSLVVIGKCLILSCTIKKKGK